jgi:membrane associated rhomboid family serine protease
MPSSRQTQFDFSGMFSRPPQATLALMIATGVVSVLGMVSRGRFGTGGLAQLLLFNPSQVLDSARIWTPFTYLFLDSDPLNLLLYEVFGLWMFASPLEHRWGARRFLYYFFGTGTGAALLTTLLGASSLVLRAYPAFPGTHIAGAAILVGWVLTNWHSTAYLLVFPVRAPFLLVFALGVPVLYIIQGDWEPFVPVYAAMGIGYAMLRKGISPRGAYLHFRAWWIDRQLKRKARHLRVIPPPDNGHDRKGPDKYLH